jgi:two-component system response regulator AtoC
MGCFMSQAPAAATSPQLPRWLRHVGPVEAILALAELAAEQAGPDAAVFAVDQDRNVLYWSEGAERLFMLPAGQILGEHCLKANRCASCMRECGLQTRGTIRGATLALHRADGTPVWVRKDARALTAPDGTFLGGFEVLVPLGTAQHGPDAPAAVRLGDPEPTQARDFHGIISQDPSMHQIFEMIRNVGATEANVLLRGASGTGKELAAKAIHLQSPRRDQPFLAINCATLSPTLLESELFGHVKGAFTGAIRDRAGLFREADGGTLFLDEVAEVPLELQARLLRVLQDRTVVPVGSSKAVHVNVRIVAATHTSLRQRVRSGHFREDLMYRLRVVPIFLPPLRERRGDVGLLFRRFVAEQNQQGIRRVDAVAPEVLRAIEAHDWPGNVRELHNVVEYAFAVGRGPVFSLDDLPPELREAEPPPEVSEVVDDEAEAERIRAALVEAEGHVGRAAAALGMSRPTFWRHRKRLGI